MDYIWRIRDEKNRVIVRETDLLTRYLFKEVIAWNDRSVKTFYHDGFLEGIPFYQIYHPNLHSLNIWPHFSGQPSYFDINFSGNKVTVQQIYVNGVSENYTYVGKNPIEIIFGIY